MNQIAEEIEIACKNNFEENKGDCNKFAIAVAAEFNILLSGLADNIVDEIQSNGWTRLNDGIEAKNKADEGFFVIGGLKAADTIPAVSKPPYKHGHVVVVLSGPLAGGKYPTAIWGSLGGPLPSLGKDTVNFAWTKVNRDRIIYSARQI